MQLRTGLRLTIGCVIMGGWASLATAALPLEEAIKAEAAIMLPASKFWDAPQGKPGAPGDFIRSEVVEGLPLPKGASATRVLYWSNDLYQNPSVASALVVTPPGTPPEGGWPLVVWAHGTTGVAKMCGASNTSEMGYFVPTLLAQDFAVLAIDYAGMATEGGHKYLNKIVNANDTINAVPAAHKAIKDITQNWVAIGHSQGGLAAWGVAEQQSQRKDPHYLGAVALAPAVGGEKLIESAGHLPGGLFYPVYTAWAIKQQYPRFDINSILTPEAARHYDDVVSKGCYYYADSVYSQFKPGTILKNGWNQKPYVEDFFDISEVGKQAFSSPLLVAVGKADTATPIAITEPLAQKACSVGGNLVYHRYEGDHETMLDSSLSDVTVWIKDRFSGKPVTEACSFN